MRAKSRPIYLSLPNIHWNNMRKTARTLALCICTTAFFMVSCIQMTDELDLNKEISLDMEIGHGGLSIPIGSLSKIYLDSLIKIDGDDSVLDTIEGGLYGITLDGSIDKVNVNVGDVTINIPNPGIEPLSTSFENPEPGSVVFSPDSSQTVISIEHISLSEVNERLPLLSSSFQTPVVPVPGTSEPLLFRQEIPISEQSVDFGFSYSLPSDVQKLNKVYFGEQQGIKTGQKITLNVNLSGVFNVLSLPKFRVTSLKVIFPDRFEIVKDEDIHNYIPKDKGEVTVNGSTFEITMESYDVTGLSKDSPILPVTLFVKSADYSDFTGQIDFNDVIKYSLSIGVDGSTYQTNPTTFQVGVSLSAKMNMSEIDVDTKGKNKNIEKKTFESSSIVSGLDGISKIEKITFKEGSMLYLELDSIAIHPFEIAQSSKVLIEFPEFYEFSDECRDVSGNIVGNWCASNKLELNLPKSLGKKVILGVKSIDCSSFEVDKNTSSMKVTNSVSYSGNVDISEGKGIGLSALDILGEKVFKIVVGGEFNIDQATIETGELGTDICDSTLISINEKVDEALVKIERIELANPAGVSFNMHFAGVPSTIEEIRFNDTIWFPKFIGLQYTGSDPRIKVTGNELIVDGSIYANELDGNGNGFTIEKLAISGLYFEDPLELENGYLKLENEKVLIKGYVRVNNQKINSGELNEITVTPTVTFDPVVVKSFQGKVNPVISPIHEGLSLDMGDDVDFLKDEKNKLQLSDPRITLHVRNSVTLPILLDVKLSSKDKNGEYIGKDITPDNGPIKLEACDPNAEVRETTLIISRYQRESHGDTVYVSISRLNELLNTIPDSVLFDMVPSIDQSVDHYVDLTRELYVSGDFKVSVPLSFDKVYIEYSDTIKDLGKDLEDIGDKIEEAELQLLATVESTIPLGVKLEAYALDSKKREMNDMKIVPCVIEAGNDNGSVSTMSLDVKIEKGALKNLDAIRFVAACQSDETNDEASLKKGQYIHVKDIKLKFPQGIKVDLTETKDKK